MNDESMAEAEERERAQGEDLYKRLMETVADWATEQPDNHVNLRSVKFAQYCFNEHLDSAIEEVLVDSGQSQSHES